MNTNANAWLKASVNGSHIQLSAKTGDVETFQFVGTANCVVAIPSWTKCSPPQLSLGPVPGKRDVLALGVKYKRPGKNGQSGWLDFLLPMSCAPQPYLELDTFKKPFLPLGSDCMVELTEDGLFLTVGGQRFVAPEDLSADRKAAWTRQGIKVVPNPDLLLCFAVGQATIGQVQAAAEALKQEETLPTKYAALEKQLAEANSALTQARSEFDKRLMDEKKHSLARADILTEKTEKIENVIAYLEHIAINAKFGKRKKALREIVQKCWKALEQIS